MILIPVGGAIYLRDPENRKNFFSVLDRFKEVFVQEFRALIGRDNRTALAVVVGAIAIVLAIVFSGMNRGGQPASSGGREFIKGTPYAGSNPGEVQYSCPDGYRHGKASIWDPYCYKK